MLAAGTTICVSPQVLRECLVVLTRPHADGTVPSIPDALHNVARIEAASRLLAETGDSVRALFKLVGDFSVAGKNVHDANIVATMIAHGVRRLKTHNVADFQRFKHLIQIEPLMT